MRRHLAASLLLLALLLPPRALLAADLHPFDLPPGFVQEVIARDLGPVTAFALRPDGSILIARKHGSVKVWRDGAVLEAPFVDLSDQVNIYGDRGLMGIAVHPDYPRSAYVYLAYAYDPPGAEAHAESGARTARVVRVEVDPARPDQARPGSLTVLLGKNGAPDYAGNLDRGDRPPYSCMAGEGGVDAPPVQDCLPVDGPSHTVDGLVFGPDGALYVSAGDGTLQPDLNVRAQNLDSLAGKILRVDPLTGAGYPGNPFYDGDPQSNRSKVYALGMRNPYRFTFDPEGVLVVGDVGGERYEEINRGPAGANFGWPCLEGPLPNSGAAACAGVLDGSTATVAAWHSYAHEGGYSAAIGGDFYTGDGFPAAYQGAYFFADHNRAALLTLPPGAGEGSEAQWFAGNVIAPVQITQGPDGGLYVLSFVDGALSRIRYTGGETGPAQASAESNADGAPAGTAEAGPEGGPDAGADAEAAAQDSAAAGAPDVRILAPADGSGWPVGARIDLAGAATSAEGDPITGDSLRWTATLLHNDHVHPDFFHAAGEAVQLLYEEHGPNTRLEVCLEATGEDGQAGRACIVLHQCGVEGGDPCEALPTESEVGEGEGGSATHAADAAGEDGEESAVHGVRRSLWQGVDGAAVAGLLEDKRFPAAPDRTELLPRLQSGGEGKDYGQRLAGFLLPPVAGEYRFWIAADDSGELWLSTSEDPADAVLVAAAPAWTRQAEWDKYPEQASAPIVLQAGSRYYIEVRHKQADQKDSLAVAWQPPGEERAVIRTEFLTPE